MMDKSTVRIHIPGYHKDRFGQLAWNALMDVWDLTDDVVEGATILVDIELEELLDDEPSADKNGQGSALDGGPLRGR